MAEQAETKRLKLKIDPLGVPRQAGKGEVVEFKGVDEQGETAIYEVWAKSLVEALTSQVGKVTEVEVIYSSKTMGNVTYHHRKVNQVFIGGQPVSQPREAWKGGGRSPEEKLSIERQVAVKVIAELWSNGKLKDDNPLVEAMLKWLAIKVYTPDNWPSIHPEKKEEIEIGEDGWPKEWEKLQGNESQKGTSLPPALPQFKNFGEVATKVNKEMQALNMKVETFFTWTKKKVWADFGTPDKAWVKYQEFLKAEK